MNTLDTNNGASIERRAFLGAGLAVAGICASSVLGGCSVLGIEDPNAADDNAQDDPGLVDFQDMEIKFNVEPSTWQWEVLDDTSSSYNGNLVVDIPVSVVNGDDASRVLSSMYCKIFAPDGTQQSDLSGRYSGDMLNFGKMSSGASKSGQLHILYRGSGVYTVQFDNLLGRKTTFSIDIEYNQYSSTNPFPSYMNWDNAAACIPQGESFDVDGLTIAFTTDTNTYVWGFISAEGDEYWNGRGYAGIPIKVTNNTSQTISFSSISYQMYSTDTYQLADASWAFSDSAKNSLSSIAPNQTVQAYLYFVYEYSQVTCYCAFNNGGMPVFTSVWIP